MFSIDEFLHAIAKHTQKSAEWIDIYPGARPEPRLALADVFVHPRLTTVKGEVVGVDALQKKGIRAVLVGGPGSGKTTLLKFLAIQSARQYLDKSQATPAPVLLSATALAGAVTLDSTIRALADFLSSSLPEQVTTDCLFECFAATKVVLYVDGLDEIPNSSTRYGVTTGLNDMARAYSSLSVIVASRPSALGVTFNGFRYLHLEPFDTSQVRGLAQRFFQDAPERAEDFFRVITSKQSLYALSSNPLLLTLLWSIYQIQGKLPSNLARLYSDFTDYMLSTWDTMRGVRRTAHVSLEDKGALLEQLAIYLMEERKHYITKDEIRRLAVDRFAGLFDRETALQVIDEIALTGLLVQFGEDEYMFPHRTFVEYFSARAVINDPERVVGFISDRDLHEVIVMACGLMVDVAPIIEAAIDKREVLLAAKCVSHGRTRNRRLAEYVITSFVNDVGQPFVRLLTDFMAEHPERFTLMDEYAELLNLWDRAFDANLTSQQKGMLFEDFSAAFFGKFFKVVYHDLNTENGEIDLVLEMTKFDPFWSDFGGEALVECKNWNSNVPLKEVGTFAHKVSRTRGIKLAFFVSVSGFTEDSLRTLKNQASSPVQPLIVPISGKDIKSTLIRKDGFEDFFKEAIRKMKHLRKY